LHSGNPKDSDPDFSLNSFITGNSNMENGKKLHWTQTPEGRAKLSKSVRKFWKKNGKKKKDKEKKHYHVYRKRENAGAPPLPVVEIKPESDAYEFAQFCAAMWKAYKGM